MSSKVWSDLKKTSPGDPDPGRNCRRLEVRACNPVRRPAGRKLQVRECKMLRFRRTGLHTKSQRLEMTPPPNNSQSANYSRAKLVAVIGITEVLTRRPLLLETIYQRSCWSDAIALACH